VDIRTFQPGDEQHQAAIYNEAAAALPKFKPATTQEVLRRTAARDFDPSMRLFALVEGQPVAYAVFNPNGRVSYPWCRHGHEALAEPLLERMLATMRQRGFGKAFAAYRGDWTSVLEFFKQHGFKVAREMVNYFMDIFDMPTVPARRSHITPLRPGDIATLFTLAPQVVGARTALELEQYLCHNPYFPPEAIFVLRGTKDPAPRGAALLITEPTYADPKVVDSAMPCFRLGAFGTEGMQTKRIKGMFSFLCPDEPRCGAVAVDLVSHAANLLSDSDDISGLAAQVPSDASNWLRYYQSNFRRQGSFPVLECKF